MNVDNENQHSNSRSLSVSTFDSFEVTIFAELQSLLRHVYRMLDSVRCCQFYPFYSSLPKHRAANNSRVSSEHIPSPAPYPAHFLLTRACGECVSGPQSLSHHVSALPIVIRAQHPDCDPSSLSSPSSINDTSMTSWLVLSRQSLIV